MNVGMSGKEFLNPLGLVGREVVDDDVDLLPTRLADDDIAKKRHELLGCVTGGRHAEDFATSGVEGRIQRQSPVPVVLETMALGAARRERKDRIEAVQSLDRGLLV